MLHQMFMGKAATFAMQRRVQVSADNVANAMTIGFKRKFVSTESLFPLVLSQVLTDMENPNISLGKKKRRYVQYGQSLRIANIERDTMEGTMNVTNRELDVAIKGKGYFQVRLPDGELGYTRAGSFTLDIERNIVTQSGHFLEPRIQVPSDAKSVLINTEGKVHIQLYNDAEPQEIGQIYIVNFSREKELRSMGSNYYKPTKLSGEAKIQDSIVDGVGYILQGTLELSNTNVIEEMIQLIFSQRIYSMTLSTLNGGTDLLKAAIDIPKQ